MSIKKQKTLQGIVSFEGIGIHSGLRVSMLVKPLAPNSGIILRNVRFPDGDIKVGTIVPEDSSYATILKGASWQLGTVEHVMAALSALELDNVCVEIDGFEMPIMDGSSQPFIEKFLAVGVEEQEVPAVYVTPRRPLVFEDKLRESFLEIMPALAQDDGLVDRVLHVDYEASFDHPELGFAAIKCSMVEGFFVDNISPARTFGFVDQLPALRKFGLAKGASLENTVVIGESGFMNKPRFKDEFMRHKLLDLIGDLALIGKRLCGTIVAKRTGHSFNRRVIESYVNSPSDWVELSSDD
jgi:UDP-3-O-[3-hydroxymyristoyl] N-acetylglucosamine deacetylase